MEKFEKLGIPKEILKSIQELRFEEPTDIQAGAIPLALQGKDIIGGSATGSGKTLAFAVPIIHGINEPKGIQSLILTPTRELAEQIYNAMKEFSKYKPVNITAIFGGVSINPQFKALETADVVVGTPGRILDHLERRSLDLSNVKHLVLDEADRMLDMGFIDDVKKIMSQCPQEKQTMLFSATIHPEIEEIAETFMKDPQKVSAEVYVDPSKMKQEYYDVKSGMKLSLLVHLLKKEDTQLVMVFCNSRRYVDVVEKNLKNNGINAIAIHGGLSQNRRSNTIDKFNNSKKMHVLVCTDVASRGLDIPGVSHVYNYDLPDDPKQYIHRIGRTARAGESGKVVNLLCDRDHENFSRVLRDYDVNVVKKEKPYIEKLEISDSSRSRDKGRRNSQRKFGPGRGHPRRPVSRAHRRPSN